MTTATTFGDLILNKGLPPMVLLTIAVVTAAVGMFSHWLKKFYKDKTGVSAFEYFFVNNWKATAIAFASMLGTLFATFAPLDYTSITVYQVLTQAFSIGYASDSVFNSTTEST